MDLIEETFLAVAPELVSAAIREPEFVAARWPDLNLTVLMDRGPDGVRWAATGALVGSVEVWWSVKDRLEAGRAPGEPAVAVVGVQ